jgi:hypothetical protein
MMLTHDNHGLRGLSTPELFWILMGVGLVAGLILSKFVANKPAPIDKPAVKTKSKRA